MFALFPVYGTASEPLSTIRIEGDAGIVIDGLLDDWEKYDAPVFAILTDPALPAGDLWVTYRLCLDDSCVYAAVDVTDDVLFVGEERFGKAFGDDSVQFWFPSPWMQKPPAEPGDVIQMRRERSISCLSVSCDNSSKVKLEYYQTPVDLRFPYLWEALGVEGALKPRAGGYVVECAIPRHVFNCSSTANIDSLNLRIVVFDDDDGREFENSCASTDKFSGFPIPRGPFNEEEMKTYLFDRVMKPATSRAPHGEKIFGKSANSSKSLTETQELIYKILDDASKWDFNNVFTKFTFTENAPWVTPMLAQLQFRAGKYKESAETYLRVMNEASDEYVRLWAQYQRAVSYFRNRDYITAKPLYEELISSPNCLVHTESVIDLAMCELNLKGYKAAKAVFDREAAKRPPQYNPYLLNEELRLHLEQGKQKDALRVFEKVLVETKHPLFRNIAIDYMFQIHPPEKSWNHVIFKAYDIVSRRLPDNYPVKLKAANFLTWHGLYSNAMAICDEIVAQSPDEKVRTSACVNRAFYYLRTKDFDRAESEALGLRETTLDRENELRVRGILYEVAINRQYQKDVRESTIHIPPTLNLERYKAAVHLTLQWGKGPGQIGFSEKKPGYEEGHIHDGPEVFKVDSKGNVYILDSVNKQIKKFDTTGKLLTAIPLDDAGGDMGYIALEETSGGVFIWFHNGFTKTFRQYSSTGQLQKTITYEKQIDKHFGSFREFDIINGKIIGHSYEFIPGQLSSQPGEIDEPVFEASLQRLSDDKPYLENSGFVPKRIYNFKENAFWTTGTLSKPYIEVIEETGDTLTLTFDFLSPLYDAFFLAEDRDKNAYFQCIYKPPSEFWGKNPPVIVKCNPRLEPAAVITDIHVLTEFMMAKRFIVDDNGTIYCMTPTHKHVQVIVWKKQ